MLIDTHCHLNHPLFADRLPAVLQRACDAGITVCVVPGYDLESSQRAALLARQWPGCIVAAGGIHPWFAAADDDLAPLATLAAQPGTAAIGEIGLDFVPGAPPAKQQLRLFRRQLDLAVSLRLPVIIHCRRAHDQLLTIVRSYRGSLNGVLHSFCGGAALAAQFCDLGLYVGMSGSVTRPAARRYHATARALPLDRLLLETDAPSIATATTPASQVEPCHTAEIARMVARLRGIDDDELARATTRNARTLFSLAAQALP